MNSLKLICFHIESHIRQSAPVQPGMPPAHLHGPHHEQTLDHQHGRHGGTRVPQGMQHIAPDEGRPIFSEAAISERQKRLERDSKERCPGAVHHCRAHPHLQSPANATHGKTSAQAKAERSDHLVADGGLHGRVGDGGDPLQAIGT